MTHSPINNNHASQLETWERTPSYAPTPGFFGHERTPSRYCPSPNNTIYGRSTPFSESQFGQINSLGEVGWDNESIYYVIEWKVTLNHRISTTDTEQDLNQKPSSYWEKIRKKANDVVQQKKSRNQRVRCDDTMVIVSVNHRSHRNLTKRFEKTDVDWTSIERQLLKWKALFHEGKELRIEICINYLEDDNSRTDKRGPSSTTAGMLREREAQIDAERSFGQTFAWRHVYRVMRCPGRPCHHNGQFCWLDPVGKKHYKLLAHHIRNLVAHMEDGGTLETHDDIPYTLRETIYAEEERDKERKQKASNPITGSMCHPINIHVLPTQSSQPLTLSSGGNETNPSQTTQADPIDIPGPLEEVVEEYSNWQLSQVNTELFRGNIKNARDIALNNCLDIRQIRDEINPEFFIERGVKIGVARRFVNDINLWVNHKINQANAVRLG